MLSFFIHYLGRTVIIIAHRLSTIQNAGNFIFWFKWPHNLL